MAKRPDDITVRLSRRELALLFGAVERAPLPGDPDDQRQLLELRDLFERELRGGRGPGR